jgi:hypothetical protein
MDLALHTIRIEPRVIHSSVGESPLDKIWQEIGKFR